MYALPGVAFNSMCESPTEPAREKEQNQPSTGRGGDDDGGESGGEGGKEARKQGEGPPVVQHKQLQTATYAVDDGNTGTFDS